MKRSEFTKMFKQLLKDMDEGYYGQVEFIYEIWDYFNNEQMRNKELWKEVQRLRKKYEPTTQQSEGKDK